MEISKEHFKKEYSRALTSLYASEIHDLTPLEQYITLGSVVKEYTAQNWMQTKKEYQQDQAKQVYYFSIEFLPGKLLKSNLLNLGILDTVREGLAELGVEFASLEAIEADPGLGNGGLGRLAACFMDSMATCDVPGNGNGIRYRYGLFKQKFVNGYQVELPDDWLRHANVWETRRENKAEIVRFFGDVHLEEDKDGNIKPIYAHTEDILAVPYDTAMTGYENDTVNNLRLWSAEIPPSEEMDYFSEERRKSIHSISEMLYPDDSSYDGRLLRLKQEYFFVSAGVQSIIRYYRKLGVPMEHLAEKISIHINDTHPTMCIPELMRILLDEEGLSWDAAWAITMKTCSYTNHTIMAEALEKWPEQMVSNLVPRIYQIICEINRRHLESMTPLYGENFTHRTAVIQDGVIHMAHLAIIGSHSINGVAKLHTEILKEKALHDFYLAYPARFNNKTNGITHRRWLLLSNEGLSDLISDYIGTEWKKKPNELYLLKAFKEDTVLLEKLEQVKLANKKRLADYVKEAMGIEIDPNAVFDVQIKRLHAYKRQLLNVLHILSLYLKLKETHSEEEIVPRVFIFGAKAAPSYSYAKEIIKLINAVADLINNDTTIDNKIKVVFVENYGVTLAEKIIPAADISEQISLVTKEASGTSNMKLMLNGAITLATLDGANVEIRDKVGDENMLLFGMQDQELYHFYDSNSYHSQEIYDHNPRLKRCLDALVDGTIPNIEAEGREIFDSLLKYNDEYFVLKDYESYVHAQSRIDGLYRDRKKWNQMSLLNIAHAGEFSSDYTIMHYADEIWNVHHNKNL
ncbi:glucan phosphorylase [Listeria newyorkensis]|uniref:Alpha-1,4 glucan phosphorylase n=1 Tax=Listeria newyorkensis TaxID=1497681 RepID=A0ABX4XUK4_9LIST|nr:MULTISPECIES: glycogen/starch/alpha-glucan phosphorylase [Listeria]KGL39421.1 glucan phosphorylase [Listeriaceae bacterium FSL A5-0209]KGL46455.1 glucan phosphorylase [Listeria newyorkensis]KMT63171.1 glycogen phosphorylase [Listeria newyorkensis]PNP92983.1 glucan phosphorylase [Listeria newyorkensis]RQW66974.1 glycogen/starch/alpha-glucan phosphorylase [Listeria sp. SHR_NRA_18]